MLVNSSVKTPAPEASWSSLGSFRRSLAFEQFLKINPFPLRLGEKRRSCPSLEIANDDTDE
jgi:hypothetical protein